MSGGRERVYDDACGTALALEFVGERWSLLIMRELVYGPRRFGEIRGNLPGISANVLTQRLERLVDADIVVRRTLPSPANVQVYELTQWGLEAAPLMRGLGQWAARSPRHDPLLFMSSASAMMSLETLADYPRLGGLDMTVAFHLPDGTFTLRIANGALDVMRGEAARPDLTLTGDTMALRRSLYGKEGFDRDGLLALTGNSATAQTFTDLFSLPEKVARTVESRAT